MADEIVRRDVQPEHERNNVSPSRWQVLKDQASMIAQSEINGQPVFTENRYAIGSKLLEGYLMGLKPLQSLTHISFIKGKVTISAEQMRSMILQACGPASFIVEEIDDKHCTVSYRREGYPKRYTYTNTMEMAKKSGLLNNANYTRNPDSMLLARATSHVARMSFPDVIAGSYTPEDFGEERDVELPQELKVGELKEVKELDDNLPTPLQIERFTELKKILNRSIVMPTTKQELGLMIGGLEEEARKLARDERKAKKTQKTAPPAPEDSMEGQEFPWDLDEPEDSVEGGEGEQKTANELREMIAAKITTISTKAGETIGKVREQYRSDIGIVKESKDLSIEDLLVINEWCDDQLAETQ